MDYRSVLERIIEQVDSVAYLTPSAQVDPRHRRVLTEIGAMIQDSSTTPDHIRAHIQHHYESGRLDR
ncbi:MAG: hypothetical protein ACI855_001814, partial [Myxococcota bacterium]